MALRHAVIPSDPGTAYGAASYRTSRGAPAASHLRRLYELTRDEFKVLQQGA
jgi:hypothetical protein